MKAKLLKKIRKEFEYKFIRDYSPTTPTWATIVAKRKKGNDISYNTSIRSFLVEMYKIYNIIPVGLVVSNTHKKEKNIQRVKNIKEWNQY